MEDKQSPVLIQVYVTADDGAVREELLACQIDQGTYELQLIGGRMVRSTG